jgi:hypothetical protein
MGTQKRQVEENRERRRRARGNQAPADWAGVNPEVVLRAIAVIGSRGGAIRFGYTRDGGSYAIGILGDGDPYTEYLRPSDDIDGYFEGLIEDWEAMP